MSVKATFTAKHLSDGSVTLICRETGDRYSYRQRSVFEAFPIFRNGEVMAYRRGTSQALGLIESDARWAIRQDSRNERATVTGHRTAVFQ
jgi:hypothetical protein